MVGVPRSRGCVACQQQKKKCTVITEPPCSRCDRLNISCVGYGKRKFKFQDETQSLITRHERNIVVTSSTSSQKSPQLAWAIRDESNSQLTSPIFTMPSNPLTPLISSFSVIIDRQDKDTCRDLPWSFGAFLYEVPRCLGSNESLDAAADALAAGYGHFLRSRHSPASEVCLQKYSKALKSLRNSLSNVETACESATLCSIMIVMLVETIIGSTDAATLGHAGGAAKILKCRGTKPPRDELERRLLMALRGPVVLQAFFLDESTFTEAEWNSLVSGYSLEGVVSEDIFFHCLADASRLFQSTQRVLSQGPNYQQETEQLISRAFALHHTLTERVSYLLQRFEKARDVWMTDLHTTKTKYNHCLCTREYGMAVLTQMVVNNIICALQGEFDSSAEREEENKRLCQDICNLGERDAIFHRPLGSLWMNLALGVADMSVKSADEKVRVAKLIAVYSQDVPGQVAKALIHEGEQ